MPPPLLPQGPGHGSAVDMSTLDVMLENLERAVAAKPAPPAQTERQDSFNTLLVRFEEIASNLSMLEKKVEGLASAPGPTPGAVPALPPKPTPLYSEKAAGARRAGVLTNAPISLPPVPSSTHINRFKLGQVVI
ncbi:uncharacterized protein PGTG_16353 [Puccinia graminis f. sp. tritici CRL 75-36-700-3]|uniref:Uncharacterized protein n=1 Tax=Puccinia graminis f. sp. tritici (strain CRL 75-36-700-3 / race SCCL) TaxID=418459 RepID=E3L153_PUCGT|nr:uncharacterized protein PGTG_16353 [Puccinia graminis f. sp. tritici CRL 75-36-700-3]EFP90327.2 hypothetical protein PGTG_16353 [Puccinia graminis f. sp. tritici CRL 75-36-700-3]